MLLALCQLTRLTQSVEESVCIQRLSTHGPANFCATWQNLHIYIVSFLVAILFLLFYYLDFYLSHVQMMTLQKLQHALTAFKMERKQALIVVGIATAYWLVQHSRRVAQATG